MYEHMIAVTNRTLIENSRAAYLKQLGYIASRQPRAMVLREKDLNAEQYTQLAAEVLTICGSHHTELLLHNFPEAALELGYYKIHLPLGRLRQLAGTPLYKKLEKNGTSVHSLEDAEEAIGLGADYLFAGNIYETDCKKGLPGRGLDFLRQVCEISPVPVYAIGGITLPRLPELLEAGAAGGCMMSGFMKLK